MFTFHGRETSETGYCERKQNEPRAKHEPPTDFADSSGHRYRCAAGGVRFNGERKAWSGGTVNKTETPFTFPPFSHNNTRQRKAQRQSYLPCDQSLTCSAAAGGQAVGSAMAWA
ncbi:hypothetical protein MHYP_G00055570 [Metynnis hypsauchen]